MKRELYAVFKNGKFIEAAYVADNNTDDADRYIRKCEKKYGLFNFSYKFGHNVVKYLPKDYEPRIFIPRPSNRKKYGNEFYAKYRKHAEDDGVNYE